jgi:6-pyruvoyl-tetrahydropterin synthase
MEYAHHIENQKITKYNPEARCRSFHGHSGIVKVYIRRKYTLVDDLNMVIDFTELKPIKDFIDCFDHAMIISLEDTEIDKFVDPELVEIQMKDNDYMIYGNPRLVVLKQKNISSEVIAMFMFNFIKNTILPLINQNLKIVRLEFSETNNNTVIVEE